ncbi:four helix bundle protein [Membranicola marinus]|uniref:Four helix bundle protein n=1 Tax=Membranihabitans marinus TaxID=1227546 RepID=A0A953HSD1_9BACT|nr:four helix bundle protein [Membranihabitans marinus]MBY5957490.1 four helix bundle protein [Membranihabitans marinus]
MKIHDFRDLNVWKEGRVLRRNVSSLTKRFPPAEKFRLSDQMLRASRSFTANIAEGFGRFHYQENIQFCRSARGSAIELLDHFTCALDEEYITEKEFLQFEQQIQKCVKILNGYISYLKKAKAAE